MRLHAVTWLIVFAIAIRLASDCVLTAAYVHALVDVRLQPYGTDMNPWPYLTPRLREFTITFGYVGMAIMVEGLARVSAALRNGRLQTARAAP